MNGERPGNGVSKEWGCLVCGGRENVFPKRGVG